MRNDELREQANQFMADYNFDPYLDEIYAAEEIRAIGQDHYDLLVQSIVSLFEKAPKSLSENVAKLEKEMGDYTFEDFMEDFRLNYVIQEYHILEPVLSLSDDEDFKRAVCYLARSALKVDNCKVVDLAVEIFDEMSNKMYTAVCESVYKGYIPEGMDPKSAELIKYLAGGNVFIPGHHYFDYLDKMLKRFGGDELEDEEEIPTGDGN